MRTKYVLLLLLAAMLVIAPVAAAKTTQVQVIRYANDGVTVANQTTVDVAWMESHLPVFGDGQTPYLFQGPLTQITNYSDPAKWNPAEDDNVGKVNETIKGTYLTDLCNLVGGMQPGGELKVVASDGFFKTFAYDNVYSPQARQGPMVLAWWTAREGYTYQDGIRLFFGADTSVNPYGLHVFGNQDMKETFDEKYWGWYGGKDALPSAAQLSNKWVAKIEIFPAPASDWKLLLNGSIQREITKSYFEAGLSWEGHRATYTDANGVWEGMPLWRLVGYVDDGNEHSDLAFNRTLAQQGYTVRVIAADGYNRAFTSQEVAFSTNYIVANTLDGSPLPEKINDKYNWPLRLVGTNATGGKSVANITEIRVEGVPEPVYTPVPTVTPTPTTTPAIEPWNLQMTGYSNFTVSSDYFYEGMSCGGHTSSFVDANNVTWMGMPLWRLIGLVDDQLGHDVLIGAYNATLADIGYNVTIIAGDGFSRTFTSQEVKRPADYARDLPANYLVACTMNGSALPKTLGGKAYWPLKLVGANATGGKSVGNIVEIRLTDLPIAPAPPVDMPWSLALSGYTNTTVSSDYFAQGIACGHSGTYTDGNGVEWKGMPLWRLVGFVDDQVGHENLADAYNDTLADQGYNVTVVAGDGYSRTFTSQEIKRSPNYLVASTMNGSALPIEISGKYYWPLKLVGASATGGKSIGNISEIRLSDLPIVPVEPTPTPTTTPSTGATVLFDGNLTLTDGTFAATAYNSGSTHQVQNLTPHGALELASKAGNFTYDATDKKWETMGTFLLDNAGGFDYDKTGNRVWAYRVNGAWKDDFTSTEGISVLRLADGDLVEFYYGVKGAAFEDAEAIIRARVSIRELTTIFDGSVTLVNGTFPAIAYNSNATHDVGNLTVHGALEAAAAKGGFTYKATDKKWADLGTFLLDGVSTFDFNKTENTAWAYTLNGAAMNDFSATEGISVQPVENGDQIVLYFGVKGAGLDAATAVVRIRIFVAGDADFALSLVGAQNATVSKAGFEAATDRVEYTDLSGTWSGIPLRNLVGQVDDDTAGFNDVLAASDYTVRITAADGYNKTLNSSSLLGSETDYIVADTLNGAPLAQTMWPLRLVGAAVPPHLSVAKVAEISLEGLPGTPVGGDTGFFLVSTTPSGAEIFLEDISGTRYAVGNTTAGPLNVSIALTGTPMKKIVANLTGYPDVVYNITQYPAKGETIPVDLVFDSGPVYDPPVADWVGSPRTGAPPLVVNFTDLSSNTPTSWEWDFQNDGVIDSTEQNPNFTYTAPGIYQVNLTVRNPAGSSYRLRGNYINVTGQDPNLPGTDFTSSTRSGPAPLFVQFTDASTGSPFAWEWDFQNDGVIDSTEQNPNFTYTTPGKYQVNLTATNAFGSKSRLKANYITVTEPATGTPTPTPTPTATPETDGPFNGPHLPSVRIEAEDFDLGGEGVAYHDTTPANEGGAYRPNEGVDIETVGSITNVGWIRSGESLEYTIDTTIGGSFFLTLSGSNPDAATKAVTVLVDGVPAGQVMIGGTGAWHTFREFTGTTPIPLTAGRHVLKLSFEGISRMNLDWLSLAAGTVPVTTTTPTTTTVVPEFQTVPYGPGNNIPGRVQAENFDNSGTGPAYADTTAVNEGGAYRNTPVDIEYMAGEGSHNVGWVRAGEWLIYTVNVQAPGQYTATFRAANPDAASKPVEIYLDGARIGTVQIGTTGAFTTFKNFATTLTFPAAGKHQIRLAFPATRLNVNYIDFASGGTVTTTTGAPVVTTTSATTPTGGATFTAAPNPVAKSSLIRFTLVPAPGKYVRSVWWTFDKDDHYGTWNSRNLNPAFFYPKSGKYTPLVKITYTDGSTETVERVDYVTVSQ